MFTFDKSGAERIVKAVRKIENIPVGGTLPSRNHETPRQFVIVGELNEEATETATAELDIYKWTSGTWASSGYTIDVIMPPFNDSTLDAGTIVIVHQDMFGSWVIVSAYCEEE